MLLAIIEYPYRISNLLMVLVIPWFIRQEKQLSKLFALMLIMIGLQIIRDMAVGSTGDSESLLLERLWGPEFSSSMFLAALPFAFGGMIVYWGTPRHRILTRAALLIFWAIVLLKLFLTYSRVVWIVLVPLDVFMVIYFLRRKSFQKGHSREKGKKLSRLIFALAGAGVIMMTLLIAFNPQVLKVVAERKQTTAMMAGARWAEYQNAAQEWLTSPVWGKGFGYESRFYKGGRVRSQEYVHNFILQFLMSSGIVGLALILTLLGTSFWQMGKLLKKAQSRLQTGILLACLLTLVNIVLLCLFHTLLLKQDTYFLLAIVISITIIIRRLQEQERVSPARHSWPSLTPGLVSRAGR
jgi:O-antigen ligase